MFKELIIAEVGSVHDGSFGNACNLIKAAKLAGANAVKFQTHIAEAETLRNSPNPSYFKEESRYDYFQRTSFTPIQWKKLKLLSNKLKIKIISSPFSIEAFKMLYKSGIKNIKIASGEVSNTSLLEEIARKDDVNIILSSGMSDFKELDRAYKILKNNNLAILQCTSAYPCPPEKVGLNIIADISNRYKVPYGLSDHTEGYAAAFAAVALGANIIEKHFTFSKQMYGSDAKNSMEPDQFEVFSSGIKEIWKMHKNPLTKKITKDIKKMKKIFEKSIVASTNIKANSVIVLENLSFKKPGTGINASEYKKILNKKLKITKKKNSFFKWSDFK